MFFRQENQLRSPWLFNYNNIRLGRQSDLLQCMNLIAKFNSVALVHLLKPQSSRFINFIENVFICLIKKKLDGCKGIDIERDQYFQHNTEESTRAK